MLKQVFTFLMVVTFISQSLIGGFACSQDNQGEEGQMACCVQGHSPSGSAVAMVCCQTACGESTSGAQIETPQLQQLSLPPATALRLPVFDVQALDDLVSVLSHQANASLLYQNPPDLFLLNSSFLI